MDKNTGTFTYEANNSSAALETYEWDNVWWEQANDKEKDRVLYIGDSISCGIRHIATGLSGNTLLFDGFGTSKPIDNPFYMESVQLFARQQKKRKWILFNNGLHGFHLDDKNEYKFYYERMVNFLQKEYAESSLVLVLTTWIAGERRERVEIRNHAVREIAEEYNLPVIDLYTEAEKYSEWISEDGIHFQEKGYEKLAKKILDSIRNM